MESTQLAKQIIELIGGDDMLTRLHAKQIETVPLGVQFVVHRDNPGDVTVRVTLSAARYDVEVSGSLLLFGEHKLTELQDWQVKELFKSIEFYAT